jgi:FkbM family methyltransferase
MLSKVVASIASRLHPTSRTKRELVTVASWHLQDVAYTRLRDASFKPGGIIDIGACSGEWSKSIRKIFLFAPILMIEAREEERGALAAAVDSIGNSWYVIALLGAVHKEKEPFTVSGTGSSLFRERSNVATTLRVLPMTTLDDMMAEHPELTAPLLLKLDVQGAEIEVLKGAPKTLGMAEFVQLEVALLPYNDGAPLASETIAFMDRLGFAIFDIPGFIRPLDKHLVQIDVLFARKASRLRPTEFRYEF